MAGGGIPAVKPMPTLNCAGDASGTAAMSSAAMIAGNDLKIFTSPPLYAAHYSLAQSPFMRGRQGFHRILTPKSALANSIFINLSHHILFTPGTRCVHRVLLRLAHVRCWRLPPRS